MPFLKTDGTPLEPTYRIRLGEAPTGSKPFRLEEGFQYQRPADGEIFPAPEGLDTDLASVPWPMWGLVAPFGRQSRAAIVHDHGCDVAAAAPPAQRYPTRRNIDYTFRDALVESEVSVFRAWLMWGGVSLGRYFGYRRIGGALLVGAVVLWWLFLVAECAGVGPWSDLPVGFTLALSAILGCLFVVAARSDWNLLLFLLCAFPLAVLIICVVILDAAVQGLLWLVALVVSWFGGPTPTLKPTRLGVRST
jgi:hypothetical protein